MDAIHVRLLTLASKKDAVSFSVLREYRKIQYGHNAGVLILLTVLTVLTVLYDTEEHQVPGMKIKLDSPQTPEQTAPCD